MTWLFDSHIHLSDPAYLPEINLILKQMEFLKIKACCVSTNVKNSLETLSLSKQSDLVLPFIGIHPEFANDDLEKITDLIELNQNNISGIGEIGLDPTYVKNKDDTKRQVHVFESLLSSAEKLHKPVSIHSRKSLDDVFEIMTSYNSKNALLHWFDGSKKQAPKAVEIATYSFGPVTIYANDKQTLLSKTNPSKLLVETDGPVRFSRCFEMKSGQISFIPSVVFCASKILEKTFDEMAFLLESNTKRFLGI